MTNKTLNTRIISKHAELSALNASTTFKPLDGEIVLAKVTTYSHDGVAVPAYLMKVGDGENLFKDLQWVGAQAVDVYRWAKQNKLQINDPGVSAGNVITNITATDTGITISRASVATSDALTAAQNAIDALEDIVGDSTNGLVKDVDDLEVRMTNAEAAIATKADKTALETEVTNRTDADTALGERIDALNTNVGNTYETKADASSKLSEAKTHANDLNTAMDNRVKVLEAINHDAYVAADTALENKLTGLIDDEADARSAADTQIRTDFAAADTAAKAAVVGTSGDASTADTVYGAKKYADEKAAAAQSAGEAAAAQALADAKADSKSKVESEAATRKAADDALDGRIDTLETQITALQGTTHFIGVKEALPTSSNNGDVCIVGNKEYIYSDGWVELGDTTAEAEAIQDNAEAIESVTGRVTTVEGKVEALEDKTYSTADLTDWTTVKSGIDADIVAAKTAGETAGSNALKDAKDYTDEQIDVVENTIGGVSGRVTTAEGKITTLEGKMSTAEGEIDTLQGDVSALKAASATHAVASQVTEDITAAKSAVIGGDSDTSDKDTIHAAKKYAEEKAEAARSSAVNTAAGDATSKANQALEDAKSYADDINESLDARLDTIEGNYVKVSGTNLVTQAGEVIIFDCGGIE